MFPRPLKGGRPAIRRHNSVVRVPACLAGSPGFESPCRRHVFCIGSLAQLVRAPACHAGGHGFKPRTGRQAFKSHSSRGPGQHPLKVRTRIRIPHATPPPLLPSSSGQGYRVFTPATRVRIPLGVPFANNHWPIRLAGQDAGTSLRGQGFDSLMGCQILFSSQYRCVRSSGDRALACEAKGRWFNSTRTHQAIQASVAQWNQSNGFRHRGSGVQVSPDAPLSACLV